LYVHDKRNDIDASESSVTNAVLSEISLWGGNLELLKSLTKRKGREMLVDTQLYLLLNHLNCYETKRSLRQEEVYSYLINESCRNNVKRTIQLRKELLLKIVNAPDNCILRFDLSNDMKRFKIAEQLLSCSILSVKTIAKEEGTEGNKKFTYQDVLIPYYPCVVHSVISMINETAV
jgi:hypothetical protein